MLRRTPDVREPYHQRSEPGLSRAESMLDDARTLRLTSRFRSHDEDDDRDSASPLTARHSRTPD